MAKKKARPHRVNPRDLYAAAPFLAQDDKRELGLKVPVTIYAQDPLVEEKNPKLGLEDIELDWEFGLMDGPTSARIAVVDYNADSGVVIEPARVRWDEQEGWHFVGPDNRKVGRDNPQSFQFHQVNVWAIIQRILTFFENSRVLGRAIPWAFEGNRLIVVPHAGYCQNAFYDRHSKSLQFYYCGTEQEPVYTCLSHDIIAHETGHAILDGCRPYYNEISSLQTAAFHEFIADLTAILSALRDNHVRQVVAEVTGGDLKKDTAIKDLAEEFARDYVGKAHGQADRYYLRSAGSKLNMEGIRDNWSPHDCSQVLTGAMFEILTEMALQHLRKDESPKQALWHATNRFTRIALRALDYCPPVDVQFIDYARAVLHADELVYPKDALGYRTIVEKVFTKRGLRDLKVKDAPYPVDFRRYDIDRLSHSRTEAYHFLHANRELLHIPDEQDFYVVDLYDTDKEVAAGCKLPREIIVEYIWREDVELEGPRFGSLQGQTVSLLCGGTLVFDGRGNVLHFVRKPGTEEPEGEQRREELRDYVASLVTHYRIGLGDEREEVLDIRPPAVVGRHVGGVLRLEMTPHARHWGEE